jgi:hypothetical protein
LVGPGEGVRLRFPERRTDHEIELQFSDELFPCRFPAGALK